MPGDKIFDLTGSHNSTNLIGKFLIASPFIGLSDIFNKSIIYIIDHNPKGAVGLIINHQIYTNNKSKVKGSRTFFSNVNGNYEPIKPEIRIFLGGPIDTDKGFIIHSNEYKHDLLTEPASDVYISCSPDTLNKILEGGGPKQSLLMMGYTGWEAGQLEKEIAENLWIVAEGDTALIFDVHNEDKWDNTLKKMGIDQSLFSCRVGHG